MTNQTNNNYTLSSSSLTCEFCFLHQHVEPIDLKLWETCTSILNYPQDKNERLVNICKNCLSVFQKLDILTGRCRNNEQILKTVHLNKGNNRAVALNVTNLAAENKSGFIQIKSEEMDIDEVKVKQEVPETDCFDEENMSLEEPKIMIINSKTITSMMPDDFPFICRVCLSRKDIQPFDPTLREIFKVIIKNTEDELDEKLPQNICETCIVELQDLGIFIRKRQNNEETSHFDSDSTDEPDLVEVKCEQIDIEEVKVSEETTSNCEKLYNCYYCNQKFHAPHQLLSHIKKVHADVNSVTELNCLECGKLFKTKLALSKHICKQSQKHEGAGKRSRKPFTCRCCSKGFIYVQALARHSDRCHASIHPATEPECPICKEQINLKTNLKSHILTHWQMKPLGCSKCDKTYLCPKNLHKHKLTHVQGKIYKCEACDDDYKCRGPLLKHLRTHSHNCQQCADKLKRRVAVPAKRKHLECQECGEAFTRLSSFRLHKKHQCPQCEERICSETKFEEHVNTHTTEEVHKCSVCAEIFSSSTALTEHMPEHSKPFTCAHCGMGFRCKDTLTAHSTAHIPRAEPSFTCPHCERRFQFRKHLMTHMKIHKEPKPCFCRHCGREFYDTTSLLYHVVQNHPYAESPKKYQCQHCAKGFVKKMDLTVHLWGHTGEKPFKCTWCDKDFFQATQLANHLRVHSNKRPFRCAHCTGAYKSGKALRMHLATHVKDTCVRPQVCTHCKNGFCDETVEQNRDQRQCPHCGKMFLMRTNIVYKPNETCHKCEVCGKSFLSLKNFKSHRRVHTEEKPYKCETCGKAYKSIVSIKKHLCKKSHEKFQTSERETKERSDIS